MNKKNIFLALMVTVLSMGSALPMQQLSAQDEAYMLEHVRNLAKNGLITVAQFSSGDVIDQYIAVLDKNSKAIMAQKIWNDGSNWVRVCNGFNRMIAALTGATSIGLGAVAGVAAYRAQNLWNSYSFVSVFDSRPYGTMVKDVYKEAFNNPSYLNNIIHKSVLEDEQKAILYYSKSLKMSDILVDSGSKAINRRNHYTMFAGLIAPLIGAVGAGFALVSIGAFINSYRTDSALVSSSKILQEAYDNNQVLIARLKQLKYDAGF